MRIGRIVVAGLAPVLGLSALLAAAGKSPQKADSAVRLFLSAVSLAAPPAEFAAASAPSERSSSQAMLGFAALATTSLRCSLWMVASFVAVNLLVRRHQRLLLRC